MLKVEEEEEIEVEGLIIIYVQSQLDKHRRRKRRQKNNFKHEEKRVSLFGDIKKGNSKVMKALKTIA